MGEKSCGVLEYNVSHHNLRFSNAKVGQEALTP